MKVYTYASHVQGLAGTVCRRPESRLNDNGDCDELFVFAEGTEEEIRAAAKEQLDRSREIGGPRGVEMMREAKNVLEFVG